MLLSKIITGQITKSLQIDRRGEFVVWIPTANAPTYAQFKKQFHISGPNIIYKPTNVTLDKTWTPSKIISKDKIQQKTTISKTQPLSLIWDLQSLMSIVETRYGTFFVRNQYKTFTQDLVKYANDATLNEKWVFFVTSAADWHKNVSRSDLFHSPLFLLYYIAAMANPNLEDKLQIEDKEVSETEVKSANINVMLLVVNQQTNKWISFCLDHNKFLLINKYLTFLRQGLHMVGQVPKPLNVIINNIEEQIPEFDETKAQQNISQTLQKQVSDQKYVNALTKATIINTKLQKKLAPVDIQQINSTIAKSVHFAKTGQIKEPSSQDEKNIEKQIQQKSLKPQPVSSKVLELKSADVSVQVESQISTNIYVTTATNKVANHLKQLNYKNIYIKEVPFKSSDISKNSLRKFQYSFEFGGQHYDIPILVPAFSQQNVFYYNDTPYQLRSNFLPDVITSPKPFYVRFDGLFVHFGLDYKTYLNRDIFTIDINKHKMPLTMLMFALIEPNKVRSYFGLPLLTEAINTPYLQEKQTILLNTIGAIKVPGDLTKSSTYAAYLDTFLKTHNFYSNAKKLLSNMADPLTVSYLETYDIKPTFLDITNYMLTIALSGTITSRTSTKNNKVKTLDLDILQQIHRYVQIQEQRRLLELPIAKFDEAVLLKTWRAKGTMVLADTTNPVASVKTSTSITYGNVEHGSMDRRDFNEDNKGVVDPIDTPLDSNAGLVQRKSAASLEVANQLQTTDPDYPFSITTSLVPFTTTNDGNRLMMSLNHARQAIPLVNPDAPLIQTTFEQVIKQFSPFIIKSNVNGKVINENPLIIQDENKNKYGINTQPFVTSNKNLITFSPSVKIGDQIKVNDIVAVANEFHAKAPLTLGKNLYTAYMTTPYTFEDATAIDKSVQKELTSKSANHIRIKIDKNKRLLQLVKPNSDVHRGEILFAISNATEETTVEEYNLQDVYFIRKENALLSKAHKDAHVLDIKVYCKPEREKELQKLGINPIVKRILNYKGQPYDIFIDFVITWENIAILGDKLTNRYGTKGVISHIFEKPVLDENGKTIQMFINSQTVIGRKNIGQFYELYASNLVMFARKKLQQIKNQTEVISFIKEVFTPLDNTKNKTCVQATIATFLTSGDLVLYVPPLQHPSYEQIRNQIQKYNVKTTSKLTFTETGVTTEIEVPIGYMYTYKLLHQAEKKMSARSTGQYSVLGMPTGAVKAQSLDELTLYALMSFDTPALLKELRDVDSMDKESRDIMVKTIIQKGNVSINELPLNFQAKSYLTPILTGMGISS